MKHIFYLHSNICVIAAFQTIKELIERHEQVVVLLNRRTKFPFFEDYVRKYDIQYITDKFRQSTSNIFCKFYNYRFQFLPHFDEKAQEIINDEEFVLYAPSYNLFNLRSFYSSPYLIGYYYIEEGTMSYMSERILLKRYYKKLFRKGLIFSGLLGVRVFYDYKITKKFKGAICLSLNAFPWLNKNKIINKSDDYFSKQEETPLNVDAFIVTDYLSDKLEDIKKGLSLIFDHLLLSEKKNKVALKFHPTAYSYQREKCECIRKFLELKYPEFEIVYVLPSYSIEGFLWRCKTEIYSIFGLSSLCLYALIMGSKAFIINRSSLFSLDEVSTVNDFLVKANIDCR